MSRRFAPGVPDVVFGLVLASVLLGGRHRLLNDPGTLWHLRLGREVLASSTVPRVDTFTYTRAGAPWVDQSWLFDVALALIVDHGGWSSAGLVAAVVLAGAYGSLARGLVLDGRSPLSALVVAVLAAGVGATHFLIRPHILTLLFVQATFRICRAQADRGGARVFLAPALTVIWANVHGGFLAGPLILFTAAAGQAVGGPWDVERRRSASKFLAAAILSIAAALANPYGLDLYRHVGRLLVSSGVTSLIQEYQPVPFGRPDARAFEWVLLIFIAAPTFSKTRVDRSELMHTLVWLHLSLAAVRHAPLFALAAAPGLARLLDGLPRPARDDAPDVDADLDPDRAAWSVWSGVATALLGLGVALGLVLVGFDPERWPLSAMPELNRLPVESRLFHEQDWGGLIESECDPRRLAFVDDRFELFGKATILRYVNAIEGGPDWDEIRDRHAIRLVWVRPERGLARRLARDPAWLVRHRDAVSVLFERDPSSRRGAQEWTTIHGRSAPTRRVP